MQVNAPRFNPSQADWYSIYLLCWDKKLSSSYFKGCNIHVELLLHSDKIMDELGTFVWSAKSKKEFARQESKSRFASFLADRT